MQNYIISEEFSLFGQCPPSRGIAEKIMYFEEYKILRNTINELLRKVKKLTMNHFLLNITII